MKKIAVVAVSLLLSLFTQGCMDAESTPPGPIEQIEQPVEAPAPAALCIPRTETKVEHVGQCGVCQDGAHNGLWHVKYMRECCNGCGAWKKISSACGPCAG